MELSRKMHDGVKTHVMSEQRTSDTGQYVTRMAQARVICSPNICKEDTDSSLRRTGQEHHMAKYVS